MQAGDLADGPLADILRTLSAAGATGGVHVQRRDGAPGAPETTRDAVLYLRDGRLYAATSPGPRPLLGVRLVSAGAVTREALEEALESQAGELAGWRLGELLVHLGYVDAEIVTEFVIEQILDTVAEVSSWPAGSWRFRRGEKTREADDLALDIDEVLGQVAERLAHWNNLAAWGSKADAVPVRLSFDEDVEGAQMPLARTLLREVDGRRSLSELAVRCGLTTFEAGQVLALLVESGAVTVPGETAVTVGVPPVVAALPVDVAPPPVEVPFEVPAASAAAGGPSDDSALAALLGEGDDDLGLQLALLARQAEEARFAAEERRHAEIVARRTGAPSPPRSVAVPSEPVPHIELAPLEPAQEPAAAVVPPLAPLDDNPLLAVVEDVPAARSEPEQAPEPTPYERFLLEPLPHEITAEPVAPEPVVLEPVAVDPVADEPIAAAPPAVPPPPAAAPVWPGHDDDLVEVSAAAHFAELADVEPVDPLPARPHHDEPAAASHDPLDGWEDDEPGPMASPEQRAAVQAALAEVAASALALDLEPAAPEAPAEEPEPVDVHAGEPEYGRTDDFSPHGDSPFADTASLLRELSSLGLDDAPAAPAASRAPAPRAATATAAQPAKPKRKSIFGR